jgi:dihydroorotate dehydrogenase (NAD+) catalytic subunit
LINSIGLPNKGLEGYIAQDLPELARLPVPLITNVMGSTAAEIAVLLERCEERSEIAAVELNVSCPNVETGLDIGADPATLEAVVREVRPRTTKPLIVKLTPNTANVALCAQAAEEGGADAVSLINTLRAMALAPCGARRAAVIESAADPGSTAPAASASDPRAGETDPPRPRATPWLGGGTGGLSGPAIRVVARGPGGPRASAVAIPVVGMGGVQSATHARDLLDVGATLVAVGTESFRDPAAGARIARGLALRRA